MQSSSSFSDVRGDRQRPADLRTGEVGQHGEARAWPLPSFDLFSSQTRGLGLSVSADPGRPSTQAHVSPSSELPPTPVSATYSKTSHQSSDAREQIRLPGVQSLLADTPMTAEPMSRSLSLPQEQSGHAPPSARLRTVPLPEVFDSRTQEQHDTKTFFPSVLQRVDRKPLSTHTFREMPSSEEIQGLGLDIGEATPRLGSQGDWNMRTPTIASAPRMPDAPVLESSQAGRMPSHVMTSPIQPPLRNWNTDLRFDDERSGAMKRPSLQQRSLSDQPIRSVAERQRASCIEAGMPSSNQAWGLAISMDDGQHYRRGERYYPAEQPVAGPSYSSQYEMTNPPTPVRAKTAATPMSATKPRTLVEPSTSSTPLIGKFRVTGLTPHVNKTRLTPSLSAKKGTSPGATGTTESPSLKMKSKQRSEQLRTQAASVAAQGTLPSDLVSVNVSGETADSERPSPMRVASFPTSPMYAMQGGMPLNARLVPMSASPRKRHHAERDSAIMRAPASTGKLSRRQSLASPAPAVPSSPWGVFEIHSTNKAWQPLGPPALSNVLGKLNLDEGTAGDDDDDDDEEDYDESAYGGKSKRARKSATSNNKKAAKTATNAKTSGPPTPLIAAQNRPRSASPSKKMVNSPALGAVEGKENDVFGSYSKNDGSRRGTPVLGARSSVSPSKGEQYQAQQQQQRRLHSIR